MINFIRSIPNKLSNIKLNLRTRKSNNKYSRVKSNEDGVNKKNGVKSNDKVPKMGVSKPQFEDNSITSDILNSYIGQGLRDNSTVERITDLLVDLKGIQGALRTIDSHINKENQSQLQPLINEVNNILNKREDNYHKNNIKYNLIDIEQENPPINPVEESSDDNVSFAKGVINGYLSKRKNDKPVSTKETVILLKDLLGGYEKLIPSLDDMFVRLKDNDPVKEYFDELFEEINIQKTNKNEIREKANENILDMMILSSKDLKALKQKIEDNRNEEIRDQD